MAIDKSKITYEDFIKILPIEAVGDESKEYFTKWQELNSHGDKLIGAYSAFIEANINDLDIVFPPLISLIEKLFDDSVKSHSLYIYLTPLVLSIYDLTLSLRSSYQIKSSIGCSNINRQSLEHLVYTTEILTNPDANAKNYYKYKNIEVILHEYWKGEIDKKEYVKRVKLHPHWFDEDFKEMKKKVKSWTGKPGDNLLEMAKRNNLQKEYDESYRMTSKFTHLSPLMVNYYQVNGGRIVSNEDGIANLVFPSTHYLKDSLINLYKLLGLDSNDVEGVFSVVSYIYMKMR